MALKLWEKSWKRNVPNSQKWILAKPNFTLTRRTSEQEKSSLGLSKDYCLGCSFFGLPNDNDKVG